MKKISYFVLGFIFYWVVKFISIWIGTALGYGAAEASAVGSFIPVFFAIIITCILIIKKVIKNNK